VKFSQDSADQKNRFIFSPSHWNCTYGVQKSEFNWTIMLREWGQLWGMKQS